MPIANRTGSNSLINKFRSILANSYWGKLFHLDRQLFVVVIGFLGLGIFSNLIRLETSPFFVWNMYAEEYPMREKYIVHEIRYDGEVLNFKHTWKEARQILLSDPLNNYLFVVHDKNPDFWSDYIGNNWAPRHPMFLACVPSLVNSQADYESFPGWFKKYLSSVTGKKIGQVTVLRKTMAFGTDARVREISSDTVLVIP